MNKQELNMEKENILQLQFGLHELFERLNGSLSDAPAFVKEIKINAIAKFKQKGFPSAALEFWRNTDLSKIVEADYLYSNEVKIDRNIDVNKVFKCEIHNFETLFFANLNGYNLYENKALIKLENGIIAGSLQQAMTEYPELINKYWNKSNAHDYNGLTALNTALSADGLFVYVPEGVKSETPMQLVNMIQSNERIFVNTRNLIILEKNSSLKFVQCDDSLIDNSSFSNSVTEFFVEEGAELDHYKLQNKDISSVLLNTSFFAISSKAEIKSNIVTFNAGNIRNEFVVELNGEEAKADLSGLYLIDKTQHVDNQLFVRHNAPRCISSQTFKGILDDEATAVFTGSVYVAVGAVKTEAYQSNKNILLTDDAGVMSKPFLEIYNDDVKCSHGSTVGQIDLDSMFYLQQRGICEKNAKLLMMYAFTHEVVKKIEILQLQERTENMVHRRLKGELSSCDQCILHCNPQNIAPYDIDATMI